MCAEVGSKNLPFLSCVNCCLISVNVIRAGGIGCNAIATNVPASLPCEWSRWWKWGIPKGGNDLCCKHKELAGFLAVGLCMGYCKKHDNSEANCDQQASLNTCKWWAW